MYVIRTEVAGVVCVYEQVLAESPGTASRCTHGLKRYFKMINLFQEN